MTSNFRKTLIAVAVGALMTSPAWATDDKRDTGQPTGTPGYTAPMDNPGMRGQRTETFDSSAETQSAPGGQALGTQQMEGPLYSRTADDLKGMDIVDPNGDDIGKIDRIVLGPNLEQAHAVVTIGGMLGMGGRDVMISLDQLQLEGDDKLRISSSRQQLETLPKVSTDREERYTELSGDRPLRESIQDFAAFESGQQGGATPGTPQPAMGQPGTPGMGDGAGSSRGTTGTTLGTQQPGTDTSRDADTTPRSGQGTPQTPR